MPVALDPIVRKTRDQNDQHSDTHDRDAQKNYRSRVHTSGFDLGSADLEPLRDKQDECGGRLTYSI
jgi:hypothetical protein